MAKYTQADYEALLKAIKSGVLMVRYEDHWTQYRTLAEMKQLLTDMERDLNQTAGVVPLRQVRITGRKGI